MKIFITGIDFKVYKTIKPGTTITGFIHSFPTGKSEEMQFISREKADEVIATLKADLEKALKENDRLKNGIEFFKGQFAGAIHTATALKGGSSGN